MFAKILYLSFCKFLVIILFYYSFSMKHKKHYFKGFTLVELIIVITILSILATIAFISFKSYSWNARDGNRISTLSSIQKGLDIYQVKVGKFSNPDDIYGTGIYQTWGINETLSYVWYIKENISKGINMNKIPLDPKTGKEYVYGVSADYQKYQIASSLEELEANAIISTTYASQTKAKVVGNYKYPLRLGNKLYSLPSLIFTGTGDLLNNSTGFIVNNGWNLPYSLDGKVLNNTQNITQQLKDITGKDELSLIGVDISGIKKEDLEWEDENEMAKSLGLSNEEFKNVVFGGGWVSTSDWGWSSIVWICIWDLVVENADIFNNTWLAENKPWQNQDDQAECYYECKNWFWWDICNINAPNQPINNPWTSQWYSIVWRYGSVNWATRYEVRNSLTWSWLSRWTSTFYSESNLSCWTTYSNRQVRACNNNTCWKPLTLLPISTLDCLPEPIISWTWIYNNPRASCETETVIIWDYEVASCNVWATLAWTWSEESFGYYFLYGNNYPFDITHNIFSNTKRITNECSPNNCKNSEFIYDTLNWKPWYVENTGLWWWNQCEYYPYTLTPECLIAKKWPCPDGFHILTNYEWNQIFNILWINYQTQNPHYIVRDSVLKIPLWWSLTYSNYWSERLNYNSLDNEWHLWNSSNFDTLLRDTGVSAWGGGSIDAKNIRCIKNY